MSWMGWTLIAVLIFLAVFFLVIVAVSALEGWKWRKK